MQDLPVQLYRVDSQGRPLPLNALYGQEIMVEFIVKAHPQFAKDDDGNAFYNCKISPFQALLGATLQVPSLMFPGTNVDISVSPGSQPGEVIRIPNQGYTKPNCKKKRGDLVCTIVVEIPELGSLTDEQKEFFHYLGKWKSFPRSATLMKASHP
jgi:molecular chaperone DnaJ